MMRRNRNWKSFNKRWGTSRFEKFVMWSAALHIVLAALFVVPARSARQQKAELQIRQQQELERKEQERSEAQQEAELEIREMARIELAEEQLQDLFGELTEEFFDEDISALMWDELLEWFDPDLDELVDLLELEEFDQVAFEQEIDELREKMVTRLAELVLEKQQEQVAQELRREARDVARQMVETMQQQLRERVAAPVDTDIRRLIDLEYANVERQLQLADNQLAAAAAAMRVADARLTTAADQLKSQQQSLKQAAADGDQPGRKKAETGIQKQSAVVSQAATQLKRAADGLANAADQLAPSFPAMSQQIRLVNGQANAALQASESASQAAAQADAGSAESAAAALLATGNTRVATDNLRGAVQVRLAAERAARLANSTDEQARVARQIAKELPQSGEDGQPDAGKNPKTEAAIKSVVLRTGVLETTAARLKEQIAKLDLPSTQDQDDQPSDAGDAENAKAQVERATADAGEALKAARLALEGREAGQAAQQLEAARTELTNVAQKLMSLRGKDDQLDPSLGKQLNAGISAMRRDAIARQARMEFDAAWRKQALPGILQRVAQAGANRAKAEKAFSEAFEQQLREAMEKVFGEEVPAEVSAGQLVAQTAESTDDPVAGETTTELPEPKSAPRVVEAVKQAEARATAIIARTMPGVAASAARHPALNSLGKSPPNADRRAATLMTRLENLTGQLSAGRRDALGDADSTAVAAALRRHRGRKGSLLRLGGLGDLDGKAFREMVEAMQARGQQSGDEFELASTTGETSTGDESPTLSPALIAVPAPVEDETPGETTGEETREVGQPEFHTNRFAGIPLLEVDAIVIDGDLSDWHDIASLELDPVQRGPRPPKVTPKHQTAWAAHNSVGLLIAFNVADTNGQLDDSKPRPVFWMSDCVEIYIDTMNTKYSARGETNTHQFFAFPFGHPNEPDVSAYEAQAATENGKVAWKHVPFTQDVIQRAGKKTDQGWSIELLIPKTVLRKGSLKPGRIIGMNLQVDTGTDLYYFWTCAKQIISSQHPNTWGDVQFLGSDGRVELLNPEDTETDSLLPGQPLRVRVVDPDMNLNELRRDKIGVTARTAGGDTEPLILEETESGSGIFEGALNTTLAIGSDQPDRLELFEGETISVEYIDQARAFGERNVPIKKQLTVSSIGIEFVVKN